MTFDNDLDAALHDGYMATDRALKELDEQDDPESVNLIELAQAAIERVRDNRNND